MLQQWGEDHAERARAAFIIGELGDEADNHVKGHLLLSNQCVQGRMGCRWVRLRSELKGEESDELMPNTGKKGRKWSHRCPLATGMLLLAVASVASHKIQHLKMENIHSCSRILLATCSCKVGSPTSTSPTTAPTRSAGSRSPASAAAWEYQTLMAKQGSKAT